MVPHTKTTEEGLTLEVQKTFLQNFLEQVLLILNLALDLDQDQDQDHPLVEDSKDILMVMVEVLAGLRRCIEPIVKPEQRKSQLLLKISWLVLLKNSILVQHAR